MCSQGLGTLLPVHVTIEGRFAFVAVNLNSVKPSFALMFLLGDDRRYVVALNFLEAGESRIENWEHVSKFIWEL